MSKSKSLRQRIKKGEVLVALRAELSMTKAQLADAWSTGRYDYVRIEGQHNPFAEQQLVDFCAITDDIDIDVQLRIPHTGEAHLVGRYLDFGCSAILVPEVMESETVDDAIAYAYYPPVGRRSWGGDFRRGLRRIGKDRQTYAAWWNEHVVLGIQVESVETVINIRALAKPGVQVVTFGPNDLSFSLEDHPEFPLPSIDDCMRNVAAQLAGTDVRLAMGTGTKPEERGKYLDMGVTLFQEDPPAL